MEDKLSVLIAGFTILFLILKLVSPHQSSQAMKISRYITLFLVFASATLYMLVIFAVIPEEAIYQSFNEQ